MTDEDDLDGLFERDGKGISVRWFVASYDSNCSECGTLLREGELGGYIGDDDEASCENCCWAAV